jgi:type 1 glutamine amidotransferase
MARTAGPHAGSTGRRLLRVTSVALAAVLALPPPAGAATPATADGPPGAAPGGESFDALVFSRTAGFRHDSIPAGVAAIRQLGDDHGFMVTATEDAGAFTAENLAQYDVVVFLSTTGDVLDAQQQSAFEDYIRDGGGYAGVHAASDTEYDWPWYGELVGAYFAGHPEPQDAVVEVTDRAHPSTAHLDRRWTRFDEWYSFGTNPRGDVHVLAALDETSYDPGETGMGEDHPIAWCHDHDGGRSWYTGMGHTEQSYADPDFLDHLLGGLRTAAGVVDADCRPGAALAAPDVVVDGRAGSRGWWREAVRLGGIEAGRVYSDSRAVVPIAGGGDRTSGVAGVRARIGDRSIWLGRPLRLHRLALSTHRLRVVVTDRAGNRAVATTTFGVTTSFADLRRLVERFHPRGHARLAVLLRRAERQADAGRRAVARRTLTGFVEVARARVQQPDHRRTLVRDASRLRTGLAGDGGRRAGGGSTR